MSEERFALVIDGQGGRIGASLVAAIKSKKPGLRVMAVGANTAATAAMLKAGADEGATGENPVAVNAASADVIAGPIGIIAADSLLGEITPRMALAVSGSRAHKVLVPVNRCRISVAGTKELPLGEYIEEAAALVLSALPGD